MMYGYGNWWWMALMPVVWVILIGLITWAVVALTRRPGDGSGPPAPREAAGEILDRRLASGEIDLETYEKLRAAVDRQRVQGP